MAPSKRDTVGFGIAGAIVFAMLSMLLSSFFIPGSMHSDFLNLYTGASLARDGQFSELHNVEIQLQREQTFSPAVGFVRPFVRPHFYAAALAPLSLLPFTQAYYVWLTFHALLLTGCCVWASRHFQVDALMLGAMFIPATLGIAHAQDGVFMLLIMIGSYTLAERGRSFWSGTVIGLALFKFHLIVLFPLYFIVRREWFRAAGFGIAAVILAAVSWCLGGLNGATLYLSLLQRKDLEGLSPSPERMLNLYSIAANFDLTQISSVVLAVLTITAVAYCWMSSKQWIAFSATAVGSLLLAPHVYGYDATLLLLPLWLCYFRSEHMCSRLFVLAVICPLPFLVGTVMGPPWSALPAGALLVFLAGLVLEVMKEKDLRLTLWGAGSHLGYRSRQNNSASERLT
jgi:hypothetical protein